MAGASPPSPVPELEALSRARLLVEPALRQTVGQLHPSLRRICEYAFGWCEVDGSPTLSGGGKLLRPGLCVLAAESVGGRPDAAVPGAVAAELLHAFSLVHDDIMDGDELRRHRPTVWKAFGIGPAVLSGDAMLALAMSTVADVSGDCGRTAQRALARTLEELVRGQAEDLAFEERSWVGPDAVTVSEYLAMANAKTGALLGCASAMGAALAGAPGYVVEALDHFGRDLGLCFQVVDDILGIWGHPEITGKPIFSDLIRGKKTLPVLMALAADSCASTPIAELLQRDRLPGGLSRDAACLIEEAGGRAEAQDTARRYLQDALCHLRSARLTGSSVVELADLAISMLDRAK
ncbi:polyprenyl synthetase family protein [Streptomyces wuyuanensis]|uniref:polyprenyl synthetase family protein n=1 Tax=Streptomyces wuyuanensis TaxID=1196353 RepID=UPI00342C273F